MSKCSCNHFEGRCKISVNANTPRTQGNDRRCCKVSVNTKMSCRSVFSQKVILHLPPCHFNSYALSVFLKCYGKLYLLWLCGYNWFRRNKSKSISQTPTNKDGYYLTCLGLSVAPQLLKEWAVFTADLSNVDLIKTDLSYSLFMHFWDDYSYS